MKKRLLALILSLTMVFTVMSPLSVQAADLNYDLSLQVSLDSLKSNGVITNDTQFINDGGYAIYPEQTTSLNYKIIVGEQSGLYEDITVEEITCYYDANLSFEQMNCYYGNVSNDANYSAEIVSSESVEIDGVVHNSLKIKNLSLGSAYTSVIFLTFNAPRGYSGIFNNFYCEISKDDKRYSESDSTAGNALNNGVFDSINEDDAKAFLNENNLIACPYGLKYEINNESVKITDYICKDSVNSLYIPSKIEGLSVTEIGDGAFKDCATSFNTVFVPSSVKNILSDAFSNTSGGDPTLTYPSNTSIKNMVISEGVSWISGTAFYNSMDLEKVRFPSSVSKIGGVKIGGINYYGYILSCGLYLYNELPNPSIKEISVIKDSYADEYFNSIIYNDVATFTDLISYGEKVYTVHYDTSTNGGDWKNNDTRPASAGDTVNLTLTASKNGSKFIGWNTDPNATKGLSTIKMENSDIVLYAIFEKTLASISIDNKPTKTIYEIGESLNTNGLSLKLKYSDGTYETITSGFTTSGFSSTTTGTKTVTVKYSGLTTTFTVTVTATPDPTPISLSVSTKPTKTTYEIGESLNTSGLKLKLTYSDGSSDTITSGFTTSGFSSITAGTKTLTIKYGSLTTTFTVTVNDPIPVDGPRVTVESKKARAGSTVLITVSLEDNPGIWGMDLVVNYDKTQLTLTSVTNGTVFSSSEWTQGNLSGDKYILSYEASGFDNITTNGVLATLEFTVNENATVDSFASISLSYNDGDIINVSFGDINVAIVSGGINITDFVYGDLNSDGLVNKKDSLLMKMYLADNSTTIDMQAADVYVDGSINKKDSLYLKQYLAGLDVELGA